MASLRTGAARKFKYHVFNKTMCLAIPGQLLDISDDAPLFRRGRVAFGAIVKAVSLACLPDARIGDYVLVHAGIALSIIDAAEAQRVLDMIAALDHTDREIAAP